MKSIKNLLFFGFWIFGFCLNGQDKVFQTFKDTKIINTHSTETLKASRLDFRIGHRFGDLAGAAGGWQNFYGLENASDILIGFDYGISNNFMIGVNRTKGSSDLKQNVNVQTKIKLMNQEIGGNKPLNVAILGISSISTMPKSETPGVLNFFEKFEHRMSYHLSFLIARKFSDYFSLQLNGSWTFRNLVSKEDQNDLVSAGIATRIQITKSLGFIIDATVPFSQFRTAEAGFYPPLGIGLEWETGGGHVFQINLTNARGLSETDYIPYTNANWGEGEFRLGFTISRLFTI